MYSLVQVIVWIVSLIILLQHVREVSNRLVTTLLLLYQLIEYDYGRRVTAELHLERPSVSKVQKDHMKVNLM